MVKLSRNVTLYTGEVGYNLFLEGKPFVASADKNEGDYTVVAPVENVVDYPLEDELESYDVVKLSGVTVEKVD